MIAAISGLMIIAATWTPVQPAARTMHVADASSARFMLPIRSTDGRVLYTLACFGQRSQPKSNDFIYDGDFECRLTTADSTKSRYSTLLAEDVNASRDWQSRARFFGSELEGMCGDIPEFGRNRDFLLRGMRISLRISNATFSSKHELRRFTFTVSIENNNSPAARGEIASPPTISRRWKDTRCQLDNSVTPHFSSDR